jgi:predicted aspartyl protease
MKSGRIIKIFIIILFTCVVLLPGIVSAQFFGYKLMYSKKRVSMPIESYNNLVVIPIMLNGVVPLNMVVDTGVRSTIITEKLITDIIRLPYVRKITVNGPGDYIILVAYVINNVDIVMEGAIGSDQSILVLEEDYLNLRNHLGTEVHGMMGYDLFNRFIVGFDYSRNIMTLYEPEYFKPPRRYAELPLSIEDTKPYIFAKLQINDTTIVYAKLMVDSGASHALMLNPDSHENIIIPEANMETRIGIGLGGPISGKISVIDGLKFDKFEFENVVTSFPDPDSYPDTIGLVYRNGTIGGELLSRFKVIFDYFNKKIYFRKNPAVYKKKFGYNMSGITVIAEGEDLNIYKISDIKKDSPAERADLRINDTIASINGISDEKLKLGDLYRIFNYKDGKKVKMYIRRNGEFLRKTFKLEDMLSKK